MKAPQIIIVFFMLIVTYGGMNAQTMVCDSAHWAKAGTYEIVMIAGTTESSVQVLTTSLPYYTLCEIEQMRKYDKTVDYIFNYCTMIRIFPKTNGTQTTIEK
jgi:hypothetical protein